MDAKKRARQNTKRAARNTATKSALKTAAKKFLAAVETKDKENALALYNAVVGLYDRAATRGVIHKNAAARKKSRLKLKLNGMSAAAPAKAAKKSSKPKAG
jgi:small subunit ribosomal protein S20